jgi:hypothetical protein
MKIICTYLQYLLLALERKALLQVQEWSAERMYRWALQLGIDHTTPYNHEKYNSGELI